MAIPTLVNTVWFGVILFAAIVIGAACYAGWTKRGDEVFWRWIKLFSSMVAAAGIVIALINFDIAWRAFWKDDAKELILLDYIDAHTEISVSMAKICSETAGLPDAMNTCWDLENIDGQVAAYNLRHHKPLTHIKNWQNNPRIEDAIKHANLRIDNINQLMAIPVDDSQMISKNARAYILFVTAVLLVLAVAGSIGEAAFQLRITKDRK